MNYGKRFDLSFINIYFLQKSDKISYLPKKKQLIIIYMSTSLYVRSSSPIKIRTRYDMKDICIGTCTNAFFKTSLGFRFCDILRLYVKKKKNSKHLFIHSINII